jgi:hypothetical protein
MAGKETFLVSGDVSKILHCSLDDVTDLAQQGKLKGTKRGRFWIFRLSDVEDYQRKQKNE